MPTVDRTSPSFCKSHHLCVQQSQELMHDSWAALGLGVGAGGEDQEAQRSTLVQGTFVHCCASVLPGSALKRMKCAAISKIAFECASAQGGRGMAGV